MMGLSKVYSLERGAFSVQYHPEAAAGPHDAAYLFDRFIDLMVKSIRAELGSI
jgi:carbamoyl-phosphate synthase small subunit